MSCSIICLFERQAKKTPHNVAVVCGGEKLTYHELNQKSNQLAHYLKKLEIKSESLIPICIDHSLTMIISLLGILKARAAYIPVDPSYPEERIQCILADINPSIIISEQKILKLLQKLNRIREKKKKIRVILLDKNWHTISKESSSNINTNIKSNHLAYVIYTSGSTGQPKGVMIEHKSITRLIKNPNYIKITPNDNIAQVSTISFDAATFEIWGALLNGATLVICLSKEVLLQQERFSKFLSENRITILWITAGLFKKYAATNPSMFKNLTYLLSGGEILNAKAAKTVVSCKDGSPKFLLNGYGPTENTTFSTTYHIKTIPSESFSIPIGKYVSQTTGYILDNKLCLVQKNNSGELYLGGTGLARGYLNNPELTKEKFIENPFLTEKERTEKKKRGEETRLYKTGDLVRQLPDENLEFIGRIDSQVKIRGFRIEPGEIETNLISFPQIEQAIVLPLSVNNNKRLVAFIIKKQGTRTQLSEIKKMLSKKLPNYMLPSAINAVDSFPLTPNQKIDKKNLEKLYLDKLISKKKKITRILTDVESKLVQMWSKALNIPLNSIGLLDNFFELGGHSLLAGDIIAQTNKLFNTQIPHHTIYEKPYITSLSKAISQHKQKSARPKKILMKNNHTPLSHHQKQLWLHEKASGGLPLFNETILIKIEDQVDTLLFEKAVHWVIEKHDILKSRILLKGESICQTIIPSASKPFEKIDLNDIHFSKRLREAIKKATSLARIPFDLEKENPIRILFASLSEKSHRLFIIAHHLVIDGVSMQILFKEIEERYIQMKKGDHSKKCKKPKSTYHHYMENLSNSCHKKKKSLANYWKRRLNEFQSLHLPFAKNKKEKISFTGHRQCFRIPSHIVTKLEKISQNEGVTLFATLYATFSILLYRYTGQNDLSVGTVVSERYTSDSQEMIGNFLNTIVLRSYINEGKTFRDFLKMVWKQLLKDYKHQQLPFQEKIKLLREKQDNQEYLPIQAMFVYEPNVHESKLKWDISQLEVHSGTSKFDLSFELDKRKNGIIGRLEYNTSKFDLSYMQNMILHYKTLLIQVTKNTNHPISSLSMLSKKENEKVIKSWNKTKFRFQNKKTLVDLFEKQAEKTPQKTALALEGKTLSYKELNQKANQLASYLRKQGMNPNDIAPLYMDRSLEMIIGMIGILKAGATYVPIYPSHSRERIQSMLNDMKTSIIISEKKQKNFIRKLNVKKNQIILLDQDWNKIKKESVENLKIERASHHLAYIIYTSGSTGQPKGVMIEHHSIVNHMNWMIQTFDFNSNDRFLLKTPHSFDASIWEIYAPLLVGATLIISPPEIQKEPDTLISIIQEHNITVLQLVPVLVNMMLALSTFHKCTSLKKVFIGGDVLEKKTVLSFYQNLPKSILYNLYGPTEATIDTTYYQCLQEICSSTAPIGKAIHNLHIYILSKELQPLPVGIPGELYIGGEGLARGYLNDPELTKKKFIEHPFLTKGEKKEKKRQGKDTRLYKTGDLVKWLPDGNVEFIGRIDNQVKIRGFRVELGEIETHLNHHPRVEQSIVILEKEDDFSSSLIAYIKTKRDAELNKQEIRSFLSQKCPEYMIPHFFVFIETIPITENGKIDKNKLPKINKKTCREKTEISYPRDQLEEKLCNIWSKVLGINQIGIHDNFFHLGGDSIKIIQVASRAKQENIQLDIAQLFRALTIADLRMIAKEENKGEKESSPQEQISGKIPLLPIQHWFFERKFLEINHWNQAILLRIDTKLDLTTIEEAFQELLQHHDGLRSRYTYKNNGWKQEIDPPEKFRNYQVCKKHNVTSLSLGEQKKEIINLSNRCQKSLDIEKGIVIQSILFHYDSSQHSTLLIVAHHLAIDGISWRILREDLESAYQKKKNNEIVSFPKKTSSIKDWTMLLRNYSKSEELKKELPYWLTVFSKEKEDLPLDFNKGPNTIKSSRREIVSLGKKSTEKLLREVPKAYQNRINDILLTALALSFKEKMGLTNLKIYLEGHGREVIDKKIDLSRTIGWFTSIFPLNLELNEITKNEDAIKFIQKTLQQIPNNGIGYGILRYLSPKTIRERLKNVSPPEIIFNYLGQWDNETEDSTLFKLHEGLENQLTGKTIGDNNIRTAILEINGQIIRNKLNFSFAYSHNHFKKNTIKQIANEFILQLEKLIDHCCKRNTALQKRRDENMKKTTTPITVETIDRYLNSQRNLNETEILLPLQEKGTITPLFLVHDSLGVGSIYTSLAPHFKNQPLYAISNPFVYNPVMAFRTVEEMAACYVESIQKIQKTGPYKLGGWCSGGVIIYEMARQLKEKKETVEALIMISSCAIPEYYQEAITPEFFNQFFADQGIDPQSKRALYLQFSYLSAGNICYDYISKKILLLKEDQAICYDGQTILLHPEETQGDKYLEDPKNGWQDLISSDINIFTYPGTHYELLEQENISSLSKIILNALNNLPMKNKT